MRPSSPRKDCTMRMLIAIAAMAASVLAGAAAAGAGTSGNDPHFNQYPAWAQKAFTPANRR